MILSCYDCCNQESPRNTHDDKEAAQPIQSDIVMIDQLPAGLKEQTLRPVDDGFQNPAPLQSSDIKHETPEVAESGPTSMWAEVAASGEVANDDPKHKEALKLLDEGNCLATKWKTHDAVACYTRALELEPTLALALASRGAMHLKHGMLDEAYADLEEALRLDSGLMAAKKDRGDVKFKRKDYAGALEDLNAYLALAPVDGRALTLRGEVRLHNGDKAGGIGDLQLASRLGYPGAAGKLHAALNT